MPAQGRPDLPFMGKRRYHNIRTGCFLPVFQRVRRQGNRCGECNQRPAHSLLPFAQVRQCLIEIPDGLFPVFFGHPSQCQQIHFMRHSVFARSKRQNGCRQFHSSGYFDISDSRQCGDTCCQRRQIVFGRKTALIPDVAVVELPFFRQVGYQCITCLSIFFRSGQQGTRIVGNVFTLVRSGHHGIAFDLHVVIQHELRIVPVETCPVLLTPLYQQPVVSQPVCNGCSPVSGQIGLNLRFIGIAQIRFEQIIIDIRRNGIIAQAGSQFCCSFSIAFARRVSQLSECLILRGRCIQIQRGTGAWKHDECQNQPYDIPEFRDHKSLFLLHIDYSLPYEFTTRPRYLA